MRCSMLTFLFFFFSSRRRHTRCLSDWSSDVCSSDLADVVYALRMQLERLVHALVLHPQGVDDVGRSQVVQPLAHLAAQGLDVARDERQIGRASCRERV